MIRRSVATSCMRGELEAERAVFWRRRAFLSHQTFDWMDESIWKKAFYCVKTGRIEASQLPRFALA